MRRIGLTHESNNWSVMVHTTHCRFVVDHFPRIVLKCVHMNWITKKWVRTVFRWPFSKEELRVFSSQEGLWKSLKNRCHHGVHHESVRLNFRCPFRSWLRHGTGSSTFLADPLHLFCATQRRKRVPTDHFLQRRRCPPPSEKMNAWKLRPTYSLRARNDK